MRPKHPMSIKHKLWDVEEETIREKIRASDSTMR